MDVFISWSGERSRAAAEALRNWLPKIINELKPWLSSEDIDKGSRWNTDVASRLEGAKAGIICLTASNLHSDWILFEAGALSKTLQNTFVCPLLIVLDPSDVKPPLAQFQATRAKKDDILKLLKTLNGALGASALQEAHIDEAFDVWWPKLESQFSSLPAEAVKTSTHRPDRELLEEVLALVRNQSRPDASPQQHPVSTSPIGKKLPYDLSRGAVIHQTDNTITRHGMTLEKVTRLVPEKANSRKYLFTMKSGSTFVFEIQDGLTDQMTGDILNSMLDDTLQKIAAAGKNNPSSQ